MLILLAASTHFWAKTSSQTSRYLNLGPKWTTGCWCYPARPAIFYEICCNVFWLCQGSRKWLFWPTIIKLAHKYYKLPKTRNAKEVFKDRSRSFLPTTMRKKREFFIINVVNLQKYYTIWHTWQPYGLLNIRHANSPKQTIQKQSCYETNLYDVVCGTFVTECV